MSIPGTPSFDEIFNNRAHRRSSSSNSYSQFVQHAASNPNDPTGQLFTNGHMIMDEPQALSRKGSNASLRQGHHHRGSSGSASMSNDSYKLQGPSSLRQESFPYHVDYPSTLISSDPLAQQAAPQHDPMGNQFLQHLGASDNYAQYAAAPQQQASPFYANEPSPGHSSYTTGSGSAYQYAQFGSFPNSTAPTPAHQSSGDWGSEFVSHQGTPAAFVSEEGSSYGEEWQEHVEQPTRVEDRFGQDEQDQLDELVRILSRAGTPAPPDDPTRDLSPFPETSPFQDNLFAQQQQQQQQPIQRFGSRSPSPYGQATSSPAVQRSSVSPRMSPYPKPQSPPALVIPNQSTSFAFPSIDTSQIASNTGSQMPRASGGSGMGNSLLPPVNPALEHLTGMAGVSPIGPNADGPMIYIQPSTPISGLKDGRGVFDAAIRRAGQQAQSGQQQNHQAFDPSPHAQPIHHPSSTNAPAQNFSSGVQQQVYQPAMQQATSNWDGLGWADVGLRPTNHGQMRPRAKSDSFIGASASEMMDRNALMQVLAAQQQGMPMPGIEGDDFGNSVASWRSALVAEQNQHQRTGPTLDPRILGGTNQSYQDDLLQQLQMSQQFSQYQGQRDRLPPLNTDVSNNSSGVFPYGPGQFSPTSLAFYQSMGINPADASQLAGTISAPFFQSTFPHIPQNVLPATAGPSQQNFLAPGELPGFGPRRRSYAEGTNHPAAGAGTPGYGVEFTSNGGFGNLNGKPRGVASGMGHRRASQSEDLGRLGTGWGMGGGGSTAEFLQSITANDGSLLPPSRGRSHSRHSSVSSGRSASPALSVSSQGSSYSQSGRMDVAEGVPVSRPQGRGGRAKVVKAKVTSVATEVASSSRRTNDGVFMCPVPGCGSTFTRHFNLKGHMRSHNDERPYKCLFDGCPKADIGFARQHDCKRHMLLHEGLRPFECEGCSKKFARLDALTRHLKSEQGQECAIAHPLPTNPDGSAMSESQYKSYRAAERGFGGSGLNRESGFNGYLSGDDRSGAEDELGTGSGMDEYDRD